MSAGGPVSGSGANNSWTILAPEETVTETLRPLAEGTEHHAGSLPSAAGSEEGAESAEGPPVESPPVESPPVEGHPVEGHLVSEEPTPELNGETSAKQHTPVPPAITDATVPTSLEVSGSDSLSQFEGLPEGPAQSSPDPDSFSDSYTHITPSTDEPPASPLSTETLGRVEFTQEEERLNGEEHPQKGEESEFLTDLGKQADSPVDSQVGEDNTGEEAEPEVRRRRSLLAALERIERTEEEEEGEEEFQLPLRDEDSGFSVNKCILGAVILLGLGTIFFSESDYGTMELNDAEVPGTQEWLNPEVTPPPADADSTELLNKLAKGNQHISVLQAQLQAQKEEIKLTKGQAAEGAKERLRWEEVEKENTASEAAQAPVKTTTSPSSGQPEDSMQGTAGSTERLPKKPWDDHSEKKKKGVKKDKIDMGEQKKERKERENSEWRQGEKKERKDGGTEWKRAKLEQGMSHKLKDKEGKQKRHSDETKQWETEREWKKEKTSRGDEGKPWKDREGKWIVKSEGKERKEEKDWKKAKHEKVSEGKQWRGKEEKKEWKVGKERGEKHKSKEEWKGEKDWRKGNSGFRESGKEKWEKKDLKEKGEKKERKKEDGEWKSNNGKDRSKEGKRREESKAFGKERKGKERKQWNDNEWKSNNGKDDKEWRKKDERKQWEKKEKQWNRGEKDKKHKEDRKKERSNSQKHKDEHRFSDNNQGHKKEHLWGDGRPLHTHSRPSLEQPEYWVQQRDRLQHNPKPPHQCDSLESCAQAEGLLPVPFPEFLAILQMYLAKAEEAGVDHSKSEELKKLAAEFFKDGVFVHDQTSFQEFVEDLTDILEDMVEGDEDDMEEEEDSAIEEEMEGFEGEVMKKFSVPGAVEKEERSKGEHGKESGRGLG